MKLKEKYSLPESVCLMVTKNKCLLSLNKNLKEIYDEFKDPDDHILYLSAMKYQYFGWNEIINGLTIFEKWSQFLTFYIYHLYCFKNHTALQTKEKL